MVTITGEIEVDVLCTECGNSLGVYEKNGRRGEHQLHIELCPSCLEKRDDRISELEDQLESLETEIEKLKETIEAIETGIIFNKINAAVK
jgi:septal ring factor EnvC (AmiA/AmiB activator)